MAAVPSSRDIVEAFIHYKLGRRPTGAQHGHDVTAASRGVTSQAQTDSGSAPSRLQVVLRLAVNELESRFHGDLAGHTSALLLCEGGRAERRRSLETVRDELFRDGVNWGRIVAMMELGGALCTQVVQRGGAWQVNDITAWMEESLDSPLLRGWIQDNGGWEAFVDVYGESRRADRSSWSLTTVFGLAVLGAAGITLGALFTQR